MIFTPAPAAQARLVSARRGTPRSGGVREAATISQSLLMSRFKMIVSASLQMPPHAGHSSLGGSSRSR